MNPFAQLDVHDDEEDFVQPTAAQKPPKKTHQQRKLAKQRKIQEAENAATKTTEVANETAPQKIKQNTKVRNYRQRPQKELTDGHFHDRRSGTGRDDRPRKGRGNVGNLNDEMNKDKFEKKQGQENTEVVEQPEQEQKPEQPQGMTLEQYYQSKGVDLNQVEQSKKQPIKKAQIKADWIKKEKLQVLKTKEDKKAEEDEQRRQKGKKKNVEKTATANPNTEILGFGAKPEKKQQPREDNRDKGPKGKDNKKGGRRQQKVVIKEEDFPAL